MRISSANHRAIKAFYALSFMLMLLLCANPLSAAYFSRVNKDGFGNIHNTGGLEFKTMAVFQGKLYVGVSNQTDGCQVLRFDGTAWQQVNESGFGSRDNIAVSCMWSTDRLLYAGTSNRTGGQVWSYDGKEWMCLHQAKFGQTLSNAISSMAWYRGRLYVGLWDQVTSKPTEVWAFDGEATWQQVNEPGFGSPYNLNTTALEVSKVDGKEKLYAFVWKSFQYKGPDAGCEVWAYDEKTWTKVNAGREGFGQQGKGRAGVEPFAIADFRGKLYVGLWGFNTGEPWEVWSYDGKEWLHTNTDTRGRGRMLLMCCALTVFNDRLYAVATDAFGDFELWSYDGAAWEKLIGDKCATPDKLGDAANKVVNAMAVYREHLYLGVVNQKTGYQVWESAFPGIFPEKEKMPAGDFELLTAPGAVAPLAWSASNPSVARIDQHTGFTEALAPGTCTVSVKDAFGYSLDARTLTVTKKQKDILPEKLLVFAETDPPTTINTSSSQILITARIYATQGIGEVTGVQADLAALNLGSAELFDDAAHGDRQKSDNIFSSMISIPANILPGVYPISIAARAGSLTATATCSLNIQQGYTIPSITDVHTKGACGHIPVLFTLVDPDKDRCTISVEFRKDSGPWQPASIAMNAECEGLAGKVSKQPKSNSLKNLATPLKRNPYVCVWQSEDDIGKDSGTFCLRLIPRDSKNQGGEVVSAPFPVDNSKPPRDEMVAVPSAHFSIDKYEYPNHPGYYPIVNITWYEARKACQARGKDLCTREQWEAAYYGAAKKRYPYGDTYGFEDRKFCNTQGSADDVVTPSGVYENCGNDLGVYDMGGNVFEWVGLDEKNTLMADQSYKTEAMVQSLFNIDDPAHRHEYLGFRCCSCEGKEK